eukprot:TRINITY_DN4023_c0_g1_i3.p1 TRINITY_DN4023_c0_g1~~TRINITY_DN4023_c0_g1_i3.p1  ORF type:complete len:409 (+),score=70.94 TRINITY_DN4023_c0_g1_i3:186-1229(+)
MFDRLIKSGVKITSECDVDGGNLLHILADVSEPPQNSDFLKMWKKIVCSKQVSINAPNNSGETPLHLACLRNNHLVVQYLLSQKEINVDATSTKQESPLHYATRKGNIGVIKLLLEAGAIIQTSTFSGTPADVLPSDAKNVHEILQLFNPVGVMTPLTTIIPFDIQLTICGHLTPVTLCALSQTSKMFHQSASADVIWKEFASSKWISDYERTVSPKDRYASHGFFKSRWITWIRSELTKFPIPWLRDHRVHTQGTGVEHVRRVDENHPRDEYDLLFKVVGIGERGVGKTCLQVRFTDGDFSVSYLPPIGIEFRNTSLHVGDKIVKLQMWDPMRERFQRKNRQDVVD